MVIDVHKGDPYKIVSDIVTKRYGTVGSSYIVELKMRYSNGDWFKTTELLCFDGEDYFDEKYIWENDWYEGEEDVELIAAAPVAYVELDNCWRME